MKSCKNCENAIFQDEGYSNYTVENTSFNCAEFKHPEAPFDRFYGEDEKLNFAEQCDVYVFGTPIELDVDGEYQPTEKEKIILEKYETKKNS